MRLPDPGTGLTAEAELLDNDDAALRHAWHPVARARDVGVTPVRVQLNGDVLELARTGPLVRTGHGRQDEPFDAVRVVSGETWGLQEVYGLIWVAQEAPVVPIPHLPEWFDAGYHSDVLVARTHVSAGVLIDNFLDVTHFSYLHRQSFGRSRPVTDDGYELTAGPDRVVLTHDTVLQEGRRNQEGGLGQRRIATYTYHPAYLAHLQMYFPTDGEQAAATLVCQPRSATSTDAYVVVLVPTSDEGLADQVAFSRRVLQEDLDVLERMADPRLCLTVKAEKHTRADRASIEMRKLLVRARSQARSEARSVVPA